MFNSRTFLKFLKEKVTTKRNKSKKEKETHTQKEPVKI